MNLLVDIGNTRLKWAQESQGVMLVGQALLHQQTDFSQQLQEAWRALAKPEKIAISNVSQAQLAAVIIQLAQQLWPKVEIILAKPEAFAFGVHNSYPQADKLGVDRWLALIAAYQIYLQDVWIIDCGTAITIDLINADGVHGGGLICPGLMLMRKSLVQNTAALEFKSQIYTVGLANNTIDAIFNGTLYAAAGLINQVLQQKPQIELILLTGGDAEFIASYLQKTVIIDTNLVLKGLSVFITKTS